MPAAADAPSKLPIGSDPVPASDDLLPNSPGCLSAATDTSSELSFDFCYCVSAPDPHQLSVCGHPLSTAANACSGAVSIGRGRLSSTNGPAALPGGLAQLPAASSGNAG